MWRFGRLWIQQSTLGILKCNGPLAIGRRGAELIKLRTLLRHFCRHMGCLSALHIFPCCRDSGVFGPFYIGFYVHWSNWMGPRRDMDMAAAAVPHVENMEAKLLSWLFNNDDDGDYDNEHDDDEPYSESMGHMDRCIVRRLISSTFNHKTARFQQDANWLTWALTRTEDTQATALINLVLRNLPHFHSIREK